MLLAIWSGFGRYIFASGVSYCIDPIRSCCHAHTSNYTDRTALFLPHWPQNTRINRDMIISHVTKRNVPDQPHCAPRWDAHSHPAASFLQRTEQLRMLNTCAVLPWITDHHDNPRSRRSPPSPLATTPLPVSSISEVRSSPSANKRAQKTHREYYNSLFSTCMFSECAAVILWYVFEGRELPCAAACTRPLPTGQSNDVMRGYLVPVIHDGSSAFGEWMNELRLQWGVWGRMDCDVICAIVTLHKRLLNTHIAYWLSSGLMDTFIKSETDSMQALCS